MTGQRKFIGHRQVQSRRPGYNRIHEIRKRTLMKSILAYSVVARKSEPSMSSTHSKFSLTLRILRDSKFFPTPSGREPFSSILRGLESIPHKADRRGNNSVTRMENRVDDGNPWERMPVAIIGDRGYVRTA